MCPQHIRAKRHAINPRNLAVDASGTEHRFVLVGPGQHGRGGELSEGERSIRRCCFTASCSWRSCFPSIYTLFEKLTAPLGEIVGGFLKWLIWGGK